MIAVKKTRPKTPTASAAARRPVERFRSAVSRSTGASQSEDPVEGHRREQQRQVGERVEVEAQGAAARGRGGEPGREPAEDGPEGQCGDQVRDAEEAGRER